MVVIYMVVGLIPVLHWGRDIDDPITDMLEHDEKGRVANLLLFFASGLDFLLAAITVNMFVRKFLPSDIDDFICVGSVRWALITLPGLAITVALALLVPNMETLLGLLTAVVVPLSQLILPSFLMVFAAGKHLRGVE